MKQRFMFGKLSWTELSFGQPIHERGPQALLAALAIGQTGVHLLLFLHISSGLEGTNSILALAFGVFVVALVVFGSTIIMANLDTNMRPMERLLQQQK